MTGSLDAPPIGAMQHATTKATESVRVTEAARMSARTAEFKNQFVLTEAARMSARTAEFKYQFVLTEAARMASQPSDVTSQASAVSHTPTTEDVDLATEVQDCAIELLALLIEEDLPEWLATNRSALARELAVAAHRFIVGFMRITARSPELYSPNAADLTPLLLLPRN